jgi:hypothetical protein
MKKKSFFPSWGKMIFFKHKVREMQNSIEVFKSNFDYFQRDAHKKLLEIFPNLYFRQLRICRIYDVTVDFHWSS